MKIQPKVGLEINSDRFGKGRIVDEDFVSGHPNNFHILFEDGKKLAFSYESTLKMVNEIKLPMTPKGNDK